jgi:hypothetical protein
MLLGIIFNTANKNNINMRVAHIASSILLVALVSLGACKGNSKLYGDKVKEPFTGSKYESNNRYFRAVGKGVSMKDNIARKKADVDAKSILAGQVNVTMKEVTDAYMAQNENAEAAEIFEKFQDLTRQVMSTELADLRKFDEIKYFNADKNEYTVFVAYEIKKKSMFSFMKKQAKVQAYENERIRKAVEDIIEQELEKAED